MKKDRAQEKPSDEALPSESAHLQHATSNAHSISKILSNIEGSTLVGLPICLKHVNEI